MRDSFLSSQDQPNGTGAPPDHLNQAEKMRLMGEMASGVVHDFNNLLGAIIGRIQLAQCKNDLGELKKQLTQIERIALQGGETVKRLQAFTRHESQGELRPVSLNRVVDDALEVTRHRWDTQGRQKGIAYVIRKDLGPSDCIVNGLHSDLVDALANLIFNALDAMPDGGQLQITAMCEAGQCILVVADEGVGMTPEQAEQVFYPFYTTKGSDGTGLGLAVVYGVVTRHKGDIRVESEVGKGARFIITLPTTTVRVEPAAAPANVVESRACRVLLVDDDHTILDVMGEALREVGHEVAKFDNGAEAIVAMQERGFDIVITDLGMPGITGWEVARRAQAKSPRLPVIVISGWGAQLDDQQVADHQIDKVLAKPFHLNQLRDAVTEITAGQKVAADTA